MPPDRLRALRADNARVRLRGGAGGRAARQRARPPGTRGRGARLLRIRHASKRWPADDGVRAHPPGALRRVPRDPRPARGRGREYGDRSAAGVFLAERAWTRYRAGNAEGAEADAAEALLIAREATRARGHAPIAASVAVLAGMERERPFEELEAIVAGCRRRATGHRGPGRPALARAWLMLAQGDAAAPPTRALARPCRLLGLRLTHAPSVALRGVGRAGAARRGGAGAHARPGGVGARAALGTPRAVGIAQRAVALAGPPEERQAGLEAAVARWRRRSPPRARARDLRARRRAAPQRRAERCPGCAAQGAHARHGMRRDPADQQGARRAGPLRRPFDPRAGERRRGPHAERGARGGAGGGGADQPRGGAVPVRLGEDRRDAPGARLSQARHQVGHALPGALGDRHSADAESPPRRRAAPL